MKTVAVVPSAGTGARIGLSTSKPYIKLWNKPILAYTLAALNNASCIDEIIVAVNRKDMAKAEHIRKKYRINKLRHIIKGGATRFESVSNCLKMLDNDTDYVVIHDGARPFITEDKIKKAIRVARGRVAACVVGLPLVPTLKKVDKRHTVVSTPPRYLYWTAQTPQVFKKELIVKAYELAKRKKLKPTDDSMLVELLGKKVKMIKGSSSNIKITTKVDLELAKILAKGKICA